MSTTIESPSTIRRAVDRRGLLDFGAATAACGLLAAAALGHAWLRTKVTEEGYRLSRLNAESRELSRENEALRIRAAELKSPQRIEELARGKLGMAPPPVDRVVVLVGDAVRLLDAAPFGLRPSPAKPAPPLDAAPFGLRPSPAKPAPPALVAGR